MPESPNSLSRKFDKRKNKSVNAKTTSPQSTPTFPTRARAKQHIHPHSQRRRGNRFGFILHSKTHHSLSLSRSQMVLPPPLGLILPPAPPPCFPITPSHTLHIYMQYIHVHMYREREPTSPCPRAVTAPPISSFPPPHPEGEEEGGREVAGEGGEERKPSMASTKTDGES